jgi:hypothetical protein
VTRTVARKLRDALERLPSHPADRLLELLPDEWAKVQRGAAEASSGLGGEIAPPSSD